MIRITDGMNLTSAMVNENRVTTQMSNLTSEASSGKRVDAPSDDPTAYAQVTSANAQIARMTARSATMTTAAANLTSADDALSTAGDLLTQAKSLALEAANGTEDATERANTATQLIAIKAQLIQVANTKGTDGSYIFGGTATGTAPFSTTGTFSGNDQTTTIEVADGVTAQSNVSGAQAFTAAGGQDVFTAIDNLTTALQSNDQSAISAGIDTMDAANTQIIATRVNAGAYASRLNSTIQMYATALTQDKSAVSTLQDADVTSVYSELSATQTSYQAAIDVNKQLMQTLETSLTG